MTKILSDSHLNSYNDYKKEDTNYKTSHHTSHMLPRSLMTKDTRPTQQTIQNPWNPSSTSTWTTTQQDYNLEYSAKYIMRHWKTSIFSATWPLPFHNQKTFDTHFPEQDYLSSPMNMPPTSYNKSKHSQKISDSNPMAHVKNKWQWSPLQGICAHTHVYKSTYTTHHNTNKWALSLPIRYSTLSAAATYPPTDVLNMTTQNVPPNRKISPMIWIPLLLAKETVTPVPTICLLLAIFWSFMSHQY